MGLSPWLAAGVLALLARGPAVGTLPPPPPTHDCPHGPQRPCTEPAPPRQNDLGWLATNLFWPGEQDANGTVFACTYGPLVAYAEQHRKLVALGGCTPAGCPGCDGLHRRRRLQAASGNEDCPIANPSHSPITPIPVTKQNRNAVGSPKM